MLPRTIVLVPSSASESVPTPVKPNRKIWLPNIVAFASISETSILSPRVAPAPKNAELVPSERITSRDDPNESVVLRKTNTSFPSPPTSVSAPQPPISRSLPLPVLIKFEAALPVTMSAPAPVKIFSIETSVSVSELFPGKPTTPVARFAETAPEKKV